MNRETEIRHLIINLINSWPSKYYYFYNGWILRFMEGVTYRANSVIPFNYFGTKNSLLRDIKHVEKAYEIYNLPPVFMMYEFYKPKYLRKELIERSYKKFYDTLALGLSIRNFNIRSYNNNFEYIFQNKRTPEFSNFLAENTTRTRSQQEVINKITGNINVPNKWFLLVKNHDIVIGTLMGVLGFDGYLYLADIAVKPEFRRQGIATSLLSKVVYEGALPENIKMIWLQVELENKLALNFYKNLGFETLYSYYYLSK